jgi:hypothetical protein
MGKIINQKGLPVTNNTIERLLTIQQVDGRLSTNEGEYLLWWL